MTFLDFSIKEKIKAPFSPFEKNDKPSPKTMSRG
jgi:hypothetical protein